MLCNVDKRVNVYIFLTVKEFLVSALIETKGLMSVNLIHNLSFIEISSRGAGR